MSKKHYVTIAAVIDSIETAQSADMYKSILVSRLAALFTAQNDLFQSERFRKACYSSVAVNIEKE